MPEFQKTIIKKVSLSGIGLHTGEHTTLALLPASEDKGIVFRRIDISGCPEIKADCDLVTEVQRGTTLSHNGVKVSTVEHLLAAITAMDIDNVLVEIDAQEIPILDGSAKPFIDLIERAGVKEQEKKREYFVIEQPFYFTNKDKKVEITALPDEDYNVTVLIDYNSETIGKQYARLHHINEFAEEFASSRTFCFLHEIEQLHSKGMIQGGALHNAIVISDDEVEDTKIRQLAEVFQEDINDIRKIGIVNGGELRFSNEMARHKLVDVIGDLTLVGYRIKGKILAIRPGHESNVAFAKQLKNYIKEQLVQKQLPKINPNLKPVYDLNAIQKLIPHRSPFLLIDKIVEVTYNTIIGVKNVTFNEPFFAGHFPSQPVMPGVLQVEALAQTGGVLVLKDKPDPENYLTYFLKIDHCKFRHPVVPGDTLIIKMQLLSPVKLGICHMKGTIYVGNTIVTEAELTAKIFKP